MSQNDDPFTRPRRRRNCLPQPLQLRRSNCAVVGEETPRFVGETGGPVDTLEREEGRGGWGRGEGGGGGGKKGPR
jgi:hypothetical protein